MSTNIINRNFVYSYNDNLRRLKEYSDSIILPLRNKTVATIGSGNDRYSGYGNIYYNNQLNNAFETVLERVGNKYNAAKVLEPLFTDMPKQARSVFYDERYISLKSSGSAVKVYYTLDGSEPNFLSRIYSFPIYITETTTIKVRAYDANIGLWSETASRTYSKVTSVNKTASITDSFTRNHLNDRNKTRWPGLDRPIGIEVDGTGNLYIADSHHHQIKKIAPNGDVSIIAGTGTAGYSGDGEEAVNSKLNYPNHLAIDSQGNIYISDTFNNRIRKIDNEGIITTVAGNGTAGYSGDGGAATEAQLELPNGITIDGQNNLYITDTYNHCIRMVDKRGIITTIAGSGKTEFSNDAGDVFFTKLKWSNGIIAYEKGDL